MARQEYRPKFFQGFVTGALITAILAAIAFFVYGNPAAVLAQWRAMTAATPATRTTTDPPPSPAAALPASTPQAVQPPTNTGVPATTAPAPDSAGNSPTERAAVPAPTEPPSSDNRVENIPLGAPPKAADNGDAEFAMAERYLREKSGPGSSAAA